MGNRRFVSQVAWPICIACLFVAPRVLAQQSAETWQCLPEETVVAVRIPNGKAVLDAIRETKFGKVMLTEKRKQNLIAVLEKHGDDKWSEFLAVLEEYDLTSDEIISLLAGETGYAVLLTEDGEEVPQVLGLGWMQPGEELAAKFFQVIARVIDEQDINEQEDQRPIERVDLELAGHKVMQLRFAELETEYTDDFDLPDDYEDLSDAEKREVYEQAEEKYEASAVQTITYRTLLFCQHADRLLVGHRIYAMDEDASEAADELLSAVFARWLGDHASGGSDGFVARLESGPGVSRAWSREGVPIVELLGDFQPLIEFFRAAQTETEQAQVKKWIRLLGVDELGALAFRQTVDGPDWHTQVSLGLPAPRSGLMRLLDQPLLAIDPPQWVPASAVRYFQFSFDLGAAYNTVKEEVTREFPERANAGFAMAEAQVQNFAQTSLPELLSSLGQRHTSMSFGKALPVDDIDNLDNAQNMADRMAVVWQVTDEQLWSRLLKVIAPFAGMAPGSEAAEEQGFSGYRMKNDSVEGGLFLGKGYLVLGVGTGVVETVLSSLNNPPSGSNAFASSDVFATASDLLDLDPAMFAEITDNERYVQMVFSNMRQQLDQIENMFDAANNGDESEASVMFDFLRIVMPTDDELPGLMGVKVSRWEINNDGFFAKSVQEMPLP